MAPPYLPPMPPFPPGVSQLEVGSAPTEIIERGCFTVGHMLLIVIGSVLGLVMLIMIFRCSRYLDKFNCGPGALYASFIAVYLTVPKNRPLDDKKKSVGDSQINNAFGRTVANCLFVSCCVVGCLVVIAGIVVALVTVQS